VFYILVLFVFDPPYVGDLGIQWYEKINFDLVFLIAGMVYLNELFLLLSDNLKYVLNQSDDVLVDLEKDIAFIENYLNFQDLRTQATIKVNYTKEIDSYNHTIAPLILIDLIENAFKYAAYKEDQLSDINIHLGIENGRLHFVCGNEFDPSGNRVKEDSTEIGLKNLRQRLQLN
jgi:two-component system LytT family sensor kinase